MRGYGTAGERLQVGADEQISAPVGKLLAKVVGRADAKTAIARECAVLRSASTGVGPPFGLRELWVQFGATVVRNGAYTGPLARLTQRRGHRSMTINVRADKSWRRQRFTVGHEIGHLVLFRLAERSRELARALNDPDNWEEVERLCDQTAAELLMPADSVLADLISTRGPADQLKYLYDRYLVSRAAISRRVVELCPQSGIGLWSRAMTTRGLIAPRLISWTSSSGVPFVPKGISSSRLAPDVITRAYAVEPARHELTSLRTRDGLLFSASVAQSWPRRRSLPVFDGMKVPEEGLRPFEVVSFHGSLASSARAQQASGGLGAHVPWRSDR